jgi:hypothetical protein
VAGPAKAGHYIRLKLCVIWMFAAATQAQVGPVRRRCKGASQTDRVRTEAMRFDKQAGHEHQREAGREYQPRRDVPVVSPVGAQVRTDAYGCCRDDEEPFDRIVEQPSDAQDRYRRDEQWENRAVHGACARHEHAGAIPAVQRNSVVRHIQPTTG